MSREMDEYGIPGEEHVSDQELWELQQKYRNNPAQAVAAMKNMGYDGPQLDPANWDKGGTAKHGPARPNGGRDNPMWTAPAAERDSVLALAVEEGLDEDSLQEIHERADFYGEAALTESEQILCHNGKDALDYMYDIDHGAEDGKKNAKTGRLIEIETADRPGVLQTVYELEPEGDTHRFIPVQEVDRGSEDKPYVRAQPYPMNVDTTMRIERGSYEVTGVWGKDQMGEARKMAETQIDRLEQLEAMGRPAPSAAEMASMDKNQNVMSQADSNSRDAGEKSSTPMLDAMRRSNRETDARAEEHNGKAHNGDEFPKG